MKKIVLLIILIILTGCNNNYVTCKIDIENSSMEYKFHAEYKIYYKSKYVTKIVKNERYTTDNKETHKYLKEAKELEYSMLKSTYGGYDYDVDTTRTGVKIEATVDVKKLDVEKLVSDKIIDKYYTSKEEILLSGLKKHYESKSAICK